MRSIDSSRTLIKSCITKKLSAINGVSSITFVGSFEHADTFSAISDIDIIVIIEKLNESLFREIEFAAGSVTGHDCGMPGYNVKLNTTFGPLKFNDENTIVFHLMIYDIEGHRKHVNESPFTCFDWEQYNATFGENLSDIYPVGALQLNDIVGTRRSLESYTSDLKNSIISFRKYIFSGDQVIEQRETYYMDDRHKKEYAYHIIKFLMLNLLKIVKQENKRYSDTELAKNFLDVGSIFEKHIHLFLELSAWKNNITQEPHTIFERLESFILELNDWFKTIELSLPRLVFFRHAKTVMNDGSFLGIGRDPDILPVQEDEIPPQEFDLVLTSILSRTILTGRLLKSSQQMTDPLLNEIDYGLAEGLTINELKDQFPYIIKDWSNFEDPPFPEGESQADVATRLDKFIMKMLSAPGRKNTAIVTHNVIIRALLGKIFHVPMHKWHHLNPTHLESIVFRVFKGILIPELEAEQRIRYRDQIVRWQ